MWRTTVGPLDSRRFTSEAGSTVEDQKGQTISGSGHWSDYICEALKPFKDKTAMPEWKWKKIQPAYLLDLSLSGWYFSVCTNSFHSDGGAGYEAKDSANVGQREKRRVKAIRVVVSTGVTVRFGYIHPNCCKNTSVILKTKPGAHILGEFQSNGRQEAEISLLLCFVPCMEFPSSGNKISMELVLIPCEIIHWTFSSVKCPALAISLA